MSTPSNTSFSAAWWRVGATKPGKKEYAGLPEVGRWLHCSKDSACIAAKIAPLNETGAYKAKQEIK